MDDTAAQYAMVRGFESMSDVNTGTGKFPNASQFANGLWWSKSNSASAASRPWIVIADDRGVYVFTKNADSAGEYQGYYFGDISSIKSNDPYACVLRGNTASRVASTTALADGLEYADQGQAQGGLYCARASNAIGGSVVHHQSAVFSLGLAHQHVSGSTGWPYPSAVDNGLMLTPVAIYSASGLRGYYPGLSMSPQITNAAFSSGDVVSGSGDMFGRKVKTIKLGAPSAGTGQGVLFVDHVSDWR